MESKILQENLAKNVAKTLRAIAHPVRLQVLECIRRKGALNVSELKEMLPIKVEQSLLSHHLSKMRDCGVLVDKKEGMYVYYNVVDPKIYNILNCIENCDLF